MRRIMSCIGLACSAAVLTFAATGCGTSFPEYVRNGFKVGPNYTTPAAPVTQQWIDEGNPRLQPGDPNLAAWWEVFDDPILNGLLQRAYNRNLSVRAAGYQIMQAEAQRAIALGSIFPQVQTLNAAVSHGLSSTTGGFAAGGFASAGSGLSNNSASIGSSIGSSGASLGFGGRYFNNWTNSANLSWELDFWGLFRRNLESADASLEQSVYNRDEVVVLLLANVATRYVELRTLQRRLELARNNVALQEPLVDKLYKRFKAGAANSEPGYFQLKSNLDATRALIPPLETALRAANNELCILMGMPVRDLLPELGDGKIPDPANPKERIVRIPRPKDETIVLGIPGELLLRRPDVQAADRALKAKSAQIGIAEAEMYPHLGLNGTIGLASSSLATLYNPQSWTGSFGPSLNWAVANYGRLLNNVRYQNYVFQQYLAQYQNSVLTANQEAENALVSYLNSLEQSKRLGDSATSATRVTNYYRKQYIEGFLPAGGDSSAQYNQLFTTISFQVTQQDAAAQAEGNIALNLILIYRAIGGGWQVRCTGGLPGESPGSDEDHSLPVVAPPPTPRAHFGPPVPTNLP